MITITAPVGFPENGVPEKALKIVPFLVNDAKIDAVGICGQGLLPSDTFGIRMNIMTVIKPHDIKSFGFQGIHRINGAGAAANVKQKFQILSPNRAVPMRTRVAPFSIAVSKSPDIPIESSFIETFGIFSRSIWADRF